MQDFHRALVALSEVEKVMYRALQGVGKNKMADVMQEIMDFTVRMGETTIPEILYHFRDDVTRRDLDDIMVTLETIGYCIVTQSGKVRASDRNTPIPRDRYDRILRSITRIESVDVESEEADERLKE